MENKCCVAGCNSVEYPGCKMSFYSFPEDKELKTKWTNVIGLKSEVGERKICTLHFRKVDFTTKRGLASLKKNVVPFYITPSAEVVVQQLPQGGWVSVRPIAECQIQKVQNDVNQNVIRGVCRCIVPKMQKQTIQKPFKIEYDNKKNIHKLYKMCETNGDIDDSDDDNIQDTYCNVLNVQDTHVQNKKEIKIVDVSNPRCYCCLHTDKLKSLWREFCSDGVTEIYGAMLIECFALSWSRPADPEKSPEQICESCIARLKDAVSFKAEVLTSAELLNEQVELAQKIKQEIDIEMEIQPVYLNMESDHLANDDSRDNQLDSGEDKLDDTEKKPDDPIEVIKLEPLAISDPPIWNEAGIDVKRTSARRRTRPSEAIPKKYKQYTAEEVQKAVEAVAERTMSQNTASKTFKVPVRVLASALKGFVKIKQETSGDKAMDSKKGVVRKRSSRNQPKEKKKQLYPEQNLLQAFEEVWNKRMTQTEASKFYKVPRSTIFDMINKNLGKPRPAKKKGDEGPQEMVKHTTNILTIMENSNATPIRCHGDGGYVCCFCNHQYQKPDDLKNHTLFCHDFKTKKTLTKGKRPSSYFVKLDISYLKCTICNTDIDTLEKLIEHLIHQHQKPMYTDIKNHILPFRFETEELRCTVCSNAYNKFKLLQEHLNVHYQNYVCEVCNAGFVSRMILHNHTRGHKTGVFTCEICLKVYSTLRKLTYHKNLVHRHSYLVSKCGYCHQKFKSYHRKLEHLTEVHNVKRMTYTCKACNRSFNSQAALRVHRKRDHLMERKYKCSECDMEFFARAELTAHMLKHSGLREFQCDVCQKSFKRKFTLTEHMRIHENNCRFKCEQCGAAFVQKCSWRGHMRNKHGIIS